MDLGNYKMRPEERVLINALLNAKVSGVRGALLVGLPGVGKTYLAESLANTIGAPLHRLQINSWTTVEELVETINISAVVKKDAENSVQLGVCALALRSSQSGRTILLLDELDKGSESVETALLEFLQSGLLRIGDRIEKANLDNLLVFVTSNENRELNDAFYRRLRTLRMKQLPDETLIEILLSQSGIQHAQARGLLRLGKKLADLDGRVVTVQELKNAADSLLLMETAEEMRIDLIQNFIKKSGDEIIEKASELISKISEEFCKL